ncbi:transcription factor Sox-17-beta.3-like [Liolophura sinensis]|uniref:transcription factor Sox-17-beta.3-like n=1 Tax=Liolophura sinensis TaxID=3198878 RepID=UPI00315978BB
MSTKGKKKIPRPLNAFMLFANDHRAQFRKTHPGETNSKISVRLGEAWKELNGKDKTRYYQLSKKAEIEHRNKYPDYTYCPKEARSSKRARRERLSNGSENCEKAADSSSSLSPPSASNSSEQCADVGRGKSVPVRCEGVKPQPKEDTPCSDGMYRRDMWHCGQGDQMTAYPLPYGPQYLPPMMYPRFPCWEYRSHPYMPSQLPRMPFMAHPMMYACPPHQATFGYPVNQQPEHKEGVSTSSVQSTSTSTEQESGAFKTVDTSQIQFTPVSSKNAKDNHPIAVPVTTAPKLELFVPSYVQGHPVPAPFPGNVQYPYNTNLQYTQQPYGMTMMASEPSSVTVSSHYEQPYVCRTNEHEKSFSAELKSIGEPDVKTYADL